ncbi:MAG TPA: DUF3147 family protein [Candidatus Acidoferrum sp.]|nr:DUF3147 family protein [Candidatus Acidoferrum sp.]
MPVHITFNPQGWHKTNWREIGVRFVFGGMITVITGLIARRWGPGLGGLFMAFPAIFPAAATLVAKHEDEELESAGFRGDRRAAAAAALDARGAAMGAVGLMVFGAVAWKFLPAQHTTAVLIGALVAWFLVAFTLWWLRKAIRTSMWLRKHRHSKF